LGEPAALQERATEPAVFVIVKVLPVSDAALTTYASEPLTVALLPVAVAASTAVLTSVLPAEPQDDGVGTSVRQDSTCETALRAADFADESLALSFWPRKVGRAIAARMPMMRTTTRSSMSVKPDSSLYEEGRVVKSGRVSQWVLGSWLMGAALISLWPAQVAGLGVMGGRLRGLKSERAVRRPDEEWSLRQLG
jgi:hypothetical protein